LVIVEYMHVGWVIEITLHIILCILFCALYARQFLIRRRQQGQLPPGTRLTGYTQTLFFWSGLIALCLQLFRAVDSCGVFGLLSWQILSILDSNLTYLFFLCGAGLIYYTTSYYTSLLQRRQSLFLRYTCIVLTIFNFAQGDTVPFLATSYPHLVAYSLLWSALTFLVLAICVHWSVYVLRGSIQDFTKLYGAPFLLENQIPQHLNATEENKDIEELDLEADKMADRDVAPLITHNTNILSNTDTNTHTNTNTKTQTNGSLPSSTSNNYSFSTFTPSVPNSASHSTSINSIDGGQPITSRTRAIPEDDEEQYVQSNSDQILHSEGPTATAALKRLTSMLTTLKRFQYLTTLVVLLIITFQVLNGLTRLDLVSTWSWRTDVPDPENYTPTVGLSNWAQWFGLSAVVWYCWIEDPTRPVLRSPTK